MKKQLSYFSYRPHTGTRNNKDLDLLSTCIPSLLHVVRKRGKESIVGKDKSGGGGWGRKGLCSAVETGQKPCSPFSLPSFSVCRSPAGWLVEESGLAW